MARGSVHTEPRGWLWVNVVEGGDELSSHRSKQEAVDRGREAAASARTDHVVHDRLGTIESRASYAEDALPPAG